MRENPITSFLIDLLAGAALLALEKWPFEWFARRNPKYRKRRLFASALLVFILNLACNRYFPASWTSFLIITVAILAFVVYRELNQFWSIGIMGADKETRKGIDYARALSMCSSSLEFLGIGAGKLHAQKEAFDSAIDRCSRPDRPIRFLLCSPASEGLRDIAHSARREADEFKKTVLESLRALAVLKKERAKNIQVRLYTEFPVFRLMFINDEICLASHYFLGKGGDGSDAPQLHLVRTGDSRDVESLYYGFHSYFERIWTGSEEWDFTRFL